MPERLSIDRLRELASSANPGPYVKDLATELLALRTLRPAEEWHEDYGVVLWWHVPIQEPPYVGSGIGIGESSDCAALLARGWLTHWSPIPLAAIDWYRGRAWNPEVRKDRA